MSAISHRTKASRARAARMGCHLVVGQRLRLFVGGIKHFVDVDAVARVLAEDLGRCAVVTATKYCRQASQRSRPLTGQVRQMQQRAPGTVDGDGTDGP